MSAKLIKVGKLYINPLQIAFMELETQQAQQQQQQADPPGYKRRKIDINMTITFTGGLKTTLRNDAADEVLRAFEISDPSFCENY
jgi:hypothetical protein